MIGDPAAPKTADFWVFGYGSLMWRPGFAYLETVPARLSGYHRALCVYSLHYRGTRRHPGLVFGLAPGGACAGLAFRVDPAEAARTRQYLIERELVTGVYQARSLSVQLTDGSHRSIAAYCFVAEREHPQAAHGLPLSQQAALVAGARGNSGRNLDYVLATLAHLRTLGIHDAPLERLVTLVHGHAALRRLAAGAVAGRLAPPPRSYPCGIAPALPAAQTMRGSHRRRLTG